MNNAPYLTTFVAHPLMGGIVETICSRHRTLAAAKKAVKKCEKAGGWKHRIYKRV